MAYSAETQGFNFALPSLAGITAPQQEQKPFSVAGATPLQIKPLAGWSTPSSQPELVGKGIAEGVGQIGKGISVAYSASQEAKKEQYKRQQDMQKYALDLQKEAQKEKHDDEIALALRQKTLPFSGQFAPETPIETPNSTEAPASMEQAAPAPVKGTEDNKITPVGVTYVPNTDALNALTAATQQPLSQIAKYVSAGNDQGPVGTPELPVKTPQYTGVDPTATNKVTYAPQDPEWRPYRNTPEGYNAAVAESKRHYEGYQDSPEVVEDPRSGGWKVARKHSDETKQDRIKLSKQRELDKQLSVFNSDPDIKSYNASMGMKQTLGKFMEDYEAIKNNPNASGVSDIGLIDMFGRAEGGGVIREAQANLIKGAQALTDKPELLIAQLKGGAKLTQPQRDQMMRVVIGDVLAASRIANKKITMVRRKLQKEGITDEEDLPQYYIEPKVRSMHEHELNTLQAESSKIFAQKQAAKSLGKDTSAFDDKLMFIQDKAIQLQNELDSASGEWLNKSEFQDRNIPEGWAGSLGSTTIIQQQP